MAKSLFDLANDIGFDQIDREVAVWIEMGEFDEEVRERAQILIQRHADEYRQPLHRLLHEDGPYGWEFCGRCRHVV